MSVFVIFAACWAAVLVVASAVIAEEMADRERDRMFLRQMKEQHVIPSEDNWLSPAE